MAAREDVDKGTKRSKQKDLNLKCIVPRAEFDKRGFSVFHPSAFIKEGLERFFFYHEVLEMVFIPTFSSLIYLSIPCVYRFELFKNF